MNCSLCLKEIEGNPFYIDKYPHHEDCSKEVLYYLKTVGHRGNLSYAFLTTEEADGQ